MLIAPPFCWIASKVRHRALCVCAVVMVAMALFLSWQGRSLKRGMAIKGVVDLELAWENERAQEVLQSWPGEILSTAELQVWLDFIFIPGYAGFFMLFSGLAVGKLWPSQSRWSIFGAVASWAALIAGLCDVLENFGLLLMIADATSAAIWVGGTTICAWLKFALLLLLCVPHVLCSLLRALRADAL